MCIYVSERLSMYMYMRICVYSSCIEEQVTVPSQYRSALEIAIFSGLVACATINRVCFPGEASLAVSS